MHWRSDTPGPIRRPPGFIEPCLPTNSHAVPTGPQWVYEIKHDGFRFICWRVGDRVRVFSRRGHDWSDRLPVIAEAMAKLPVKSATIDGEGVVCGPDGVSDFGLLHAAVGRAFLYAFDLLELNSADLRHEPWETRRATLASLLRKPPMGSACASIARTPTVLAPCLRYGGSKASWLSAETGHTGPGDRLTG